MMAPPNAVDGGDLPAIEARAIAKSYPGVQALRSVDFSIASGEVRALLGKNGAGKSTLVQILGGAEQPTAGELIVRGERVSIGSPAAALDLGIATVHQELGVIHGLSVAENITLGRWPQRALPGLLDRRRIFDIAGESLDAIGLNVNPRTLVGNLTIAQQQLVEIAKAVAAKPRVLILDEPTSSLPDEDVDQLLAAVRRLAAQGVACIYVSHRMKEIPRIADSVTVLRDGQEVATLPIAAAPTDRIAELMVGPGWVLPAHTRAGAIGSDIVLEIAGFSRKPWFRDVDLQVRSGEIVGVAGLLGSGRSELLRSIYGADAVDTGTVKVAGRTLRRKPSIRKMRNLGFGFVPEDRKHEGIIPEMSVSDNAVLSILARLSRFGVMRPRQQSALVDRLIRDLEIATGSRQSLIRNLSGGNQQKVILSRWLAAQVRVLLLDEPTRGVDVAAKAAIYGLIEELSTAGVAVILVSSEFEELLICSHRIVVLSDGSMSEEKPADQATMEWLLNATMKGH